MRLKRTPLGEQIFKGFYDYFQGDDCYSEEEFEVYRNPQNMTMSFFSNIYTRMTTGEMLSVYVDYTVYKNYLPYKVLIEKALGKNKCGETYEYDKAKKLVNYIFISNEEEKHIEIPIASRFHIATPSTASSMLFIQNQRRAANEQSCFTMLTGKNQWSFKQEPILKSVVLYKTREKTEPFKMGKEAVYTDAYRLYENVKGESLNMNAPSLGVYMSQYFNIPYILESSNGMTIKIKKWDCIKKR